MTERARHVLLVTPAFHGYWRSIAAALEARGHQVSVDTYDLNARLRDQVWHHARHELPRRLGIGNHRNLTETQTASSVQAVRDAAPDAVVVVKGDTLGPAFWNELDRRGLPRVLWLYDEVRRTRWSLDSLRRVGPVATYSHLDDEAFRSNGIDSRHLPLAFDHRLVAIDPLTRNDEVVFVGARYPSREHLLVRLANAGLPVRAFGRDWSSHPVDRLRTWSLQRPPVPGGRDLDRADAYREMAAAASTLNIHGDQDGFTMRTFEASGVGGVQLIDRADVTAFYEPDTELLVFTDDDELVDLARRTITDQAWTEEIRRRGRARTLAEHTFDHRVAVLEASWDTV